MRKMLTTSDGMQGTAAPQVDRKRRLAVLAMVAAVLASGIVWAAAEVNNGQDPAEPLTRFDLRYQYQHRPLEDHDKVHIFTLRADKPFVVSQRWPLATRLDLPLLLTDALSRDNPTGDHECGAGDVLLQGVRIYTLHPTWAVAGGAQGIFPTASQDQMGGGKYRLVPTGAFRLVLPEGSTGSVFAFLVQSDFDVAGDEDRQHQSALPFAPLFNINLPQQWFVTLCPSSDSRINLRDDGKLFLPFNCMGGTMVTRSMVASVEIGVPLVNDYEGYDFKREARVGFFF